MHWARILFVGGICFVVKLLLIGSSTCRRSWIMHKLLPTKWGTVKGKFCAIKSEVKWYQLTDQGFSSIMIKINILASGISHHRFKHTNYAWMSTGVCHSVVIQVQLKHSWCCQIFKVIQPKNKTRKQKVPTSVLSNKINLLFVCGVL